MITVVVSIVLFSSKPFFLDHLDRSTRQAMPEKHSFFEAFKPKPVFNRIADTFK